MEGFFSQDDDTPVQQPSNKGNSLLCAGDCHDLLDTLDEGVIDMVMFSPPYDKLRTYGNGVTPAFDLPRLGKQLFRVLKSGGVAVMVIQDATEGFAKSLTTFRTTVNWVDVVGFSLFECVIYSRHGAPGAQWRNRFRVDHEYCPIFVKGGVPASFDKSMLTSRATTAGHQLASGAARRLASGEVSRTNRLVIADEKSRGTLWWYTVAKDMANRDARIKYNHPATYPDSLAFDFIRCFTKPGDTVLDPFVGSGSTAVAALSAGRDCIGFDLNPEYISLAEQRCSILTTWR